jgi:hypothetical protein
MLQRVPAILAVTAASYGLTLLPRGVRMQQAAQAHKGDGHKARERAGAARPR